MSASQQAVRLPSHAVATRNAAAQAAVLLLVEELYKVMHLLEISEFSATSQRYSK